MPARSAGERGVQRLVLRDHPVEPEALDGPAAAGGAVDLTDASDEARKLLLRLTEEPGHAVLHDFR